MAGYLPVDCPAQKDGGQVKGQGSKVDGCNENLEVIQTWFNLGVAWKPESLSLYMWALYPLCAAGTDPQEWDDKSVTGSWLQ
jgi:hypothetical protein